MGFNDCRYDETLEFIKTFYEANNRMPTRKEIMYGIDMHSSCLTKILRGLTSKDKLEPVGFGIPYRVKE